MEFEEDALRFTNGVNKNRVLEIDNPECTNDISLVGRALTAPVRIQILHMLNKKPMLLSQIAAELDLPLSSAAFHLRVLEDAPSQRRRPPPTFSKMPVLERKPCVL